MINTQIQQAEHTLRVNYNNLCKKYPFFREYLSLFNAIERIKQTVDIHFFTNVESEIRKFSNFCLYTKPLSDSTQKDCRIYDYEKNRYATFKGFVSSIEANLEYAIVKYENVNYSSITHKNKLIEII